MAMKELARITLDSRQVREACIQYVRGRIDGDNEEAEVDPNCVANSVTLIVRKKRAPRKPRVNGVASAGKLSEAEQRFG